MAKSPDAFRTISEVADWLGVEAHVLRFWETKFTQVKPVKRAGGRRYYRPSDMALLGGIRRLLHDEGLTIRGVQKLLREQGVGHVAALSPETGVQEAATPHQRDRIAARPTDAPSGESMPAPHAEDRPTDGAETPRPGGRAPAAPSPPQVALSASDGANASHHGGSTPAAQSARPPAEPSPDRQANQPPAKETAHIVDDAPPLPFDLPSATRPTPSRATGDNGADTGLAAAFRARERRIDAEELASILSRARALAQRLRDTPQ